MAKSLYAVTAGTLAATALAVAVTGCSVGDVGVTQAQPGDPVIVLSEGECEATCPVYDMTLHPDGRYLLNAMKFVRTPGVSEGRLDRASWDKAEKTLADASFWTLPVDQTGFVSENCQPGAPTVHITWRTREGRQKTIRYTAGCGGSEMREAIIALRDALAFQSLVWTDERFAPDGSR